MPSSSSYSPLLIGVIVAVLAILETYLLTAGQVLR
jgi:hypothetical protein